MFEPGGQLLELGAVLPPRLLGSLELPLLSSSLQLMVLRGQIFELGGQVLELGPVLPPHLLGSLCYRAHLKSLLALPLRLPEGPSCCCSLGTMGAIRV